MLLGLRRTPLHTSDPFSHDSQTRLQLSPPLSADHTLRMMLPCLRFSVAIGLLQVLCITADIGKPTFLFVDGLNSEEAEALLSRRQRLLPDLQ